MTSSSQTKNLIGESLIKILIRYESIDGSALRIFEKLATGGWWKKIWLCVLERCVNLSPTKAGDHLEPNLFSANRRNAYGKALNDLQLRTCQILNRQVRIPHRLISIAVLKKFIDVKGELSIDITAVRSRARVAFIELFLLLCTCIFLLTILWSLFVLDSSLLQIILQVSLLGILSLVGIGFWLLASFQVFVYGIVPLSVFNKLEENRYQFLGVGICYQTIDTQC